MDEGTIKTQNPKFRLYWCLIELIDWLEIQSVMFGIIDPSCRLLPLYLLPGLVGTEKMADSMVC